MDNQTKKLLERVRASDRSLPESFRASKIRQNIVHPGYPPILPDDLEQQLEQVILEYETTRETAS